MTRTGELAAMGILGVLALAGLVLWQSQGLALWGGMVFSFCL